jgi:hypothetical protein
MATAPTDEAGPGGRRIALLAAMAAIEIGLAFVAFDALLDIARRFPGHVAEPGTATSTGHSGHDMPAAVTGAAEDAVTADAQGRARVRVDLTGRTELRLSPKP